MDEALLFVTVTSRDVTLQQEPSSLASKMDRLKDLHPCCSCFLDLLNAKMGGLDSGNPPEKHNRNTDMKGREFPVIS